MVFAHQGYRFPVWMGRLNFRDFERMVRESLPYACKYDFNHLHPTYPLPSLTDITQISYTQTINPILQKLSSSIEG